MHNYLANDPDDELNKKYIIDTLLNKGIISRIIAFTSILNLNSQKKLILETVGFL